MLEVKFGLMVRRVAMLEERLKLLQPLSDDVTQAGRVAVELNLDPLCLVHGDRLAERQRLASELRNRGWNYPRIALALNCCEKSARRWVKAFRARQEALAALAKKQPKLKGLSSAESYPESYPDGAP